MLDTPTKKRIDDCRDILVGKLPDPKAQIEQITIGLIYKFMDDMDKEAIELGGAAKFFSGDYAKFAWDKLFDARVTAAEMLRLYSEAIESMENNPNIPPLFRDIFNNAYLPYRDPETLKLFLKTIGEFEYTHSEKLGDAFEYLLSVMGSQGDAGQFRTPRHIIDFLVAVIDPDKGQTILDPACGTAGFLISAYKHVLLKYSSNNKQGLNIYAYNKLSDEEKFPLNIDGITPDDRKKLIQNFAGYDISPDMVRLSLVNLYLHGFSAPHINEYDTLSSEERWNENADVILANPPFMSPKGGIRPHKKFTISSNRSEVLFVDYIAEHLNPNGKAGIIVPEGVIFQSGTAYKALRKMLVEHYLYAVVSLPAGVFNPYSGVKTSILLMDKAIARQRNEILFIKIDNDGYNLGAQRTAVKGSQLEEAIALAHEFVATGEIPDSLIAHTVLKTEIAANGDYNLSGERYKVGIELSSSFESKSLGDIVIMMHQGINTAGDKVEFEDEGYPIIQARNMTSETIDYSNAKYLSKTDWEKYKDKHKPNIGDILFSNIGTIGKSVVVDKELDYLIHWNIFKIVVKQEIVLPNYLKQCLGYLTSINYWDQFQKGGTVKFVNKKILNDIQIPLPPISIQEEIVAEIESYQKIIDGAKAVVANYKPKIDIDPDWEMVELGEICDSIQIGPFGTQLHKSDYEKNGIPIINPKHIQDRHILATETISVEKANSLPQYFLRAGDIIMGRRGEMGRLAFIEEEQDGWFCGTGCLIVRFPKSQDGKFFSFILSSNSIVEFLITNSRGVTMANLNKEIINRIPVPNIPPKTQRQIVAQIEKEQALVDANKQLIEIFEQKIKDRIARVWGADQSKAATLKSPAEISLSSAAEPEGAYLRE